MAHTFPIVALFLFPLVLEARDLYFELFDPHGITYTPKFDLSTVTNVPSAEILIQAGLAMAPVGAVTAPLLQGTLGVVSRQTEIVDYLRTINAALAPGCPVCGPNGVSTVILGVCSCVCTSLIWTGPTCELHTCFGRGKFNGTSCDCQPPYDPNSFCATKLYIPAVTVPTWQCPVGVIGSCTNGTYVNCTGSQDTNANCAFQCATEVIDVDLCPLRLNWATDECFQVSDNISACVCGGGFSRFLRDRLTLNYLVCTGPSASSLCSKDNKTGGVFDQKVCTPDYNLPSPCVSNFCCMRIQEKTLRGCAMRGCTFYVNRCMLDPVSQVQYFSYSTLCVWDTLGTLCLDQSIRVPYLGVYAKCGFYDFNCDNARQRLSANPILAASVNQWAAFHPFVLQFAPPNNNYIDINATSGAIIYSSNKPLTPVFAYEARRSIVFLTATGECLCFKDYIFANGAFGVLDWCNLKLFSDPGSKLSYTLEPEIVCVTDISVFNIVTAPF